MERRRFPRWPVAVLVSLGLAGAFAAVASAIEGADDALLFAKAREVCGVSGVHSVSTAGIGGHIECSKGRE